MPRPLVPDRRGKILTAAAELILESGWPGTTVAHIAERAGIGKGAVYREFDGKNEILGAVLNRSMRRMTAQVHRRVTDSDQLVDLPAVYRFGVEALLSEPLMRALYLGDDSVLGDHVREVGDRRYSVRMGWLADYIEKLQHAGVIANDLAGDTITRMLSVFTIGLVNAPGLLGADTEEGLTGTVALFAELVGAGLRGPGPVDAAAARQAQIALLEQLSDQLTQLEEPV
ncbi:TetR/AcrR family transcriptional regulator [Nocardia flavorosea]|uniref:TetR/AcrR family transcriptional regulator n=1 Tax=Nocardia flavorosea TaxID=53429 RepID=UPI0018938CF0|nr:TetR/AcrR family transcriptional regulator [Nocardia flavorosea]MBF6348981.1 TetR/AcrR family transcriptional regulator [Nocardia flavorosea]